MRNESLITRYKNIFIRAKNLIITPKKEWDSILKEKSDLNSILTSFTLPYLTIITVISFISKLFNLQKPDFTIALKSGILEFTSFFIGLLIIYYVIIKTIPNFFNNLKDPKSTAIKLTAYSSIVTYIIQIIVLLIPQVFVLWGISLYTFYIVWTALPQVGEMQNKDQRVVFTIILSLLVLFIPYLISVIFLRFT